MEKSLRENTRLKALAHSRRYYGGDAALRARMPGNRATAANLRKAAHDRRAGGGSETTKVVDDISAAGLLERVELAARIEKWGLGQKCRVGVRIMGVFSKTVR